jgi:predicted RNA-binding Zn-ribbon protein involved in translation (DUF1610 family)
MPISFQCPNCGKKLKAPDSAAGTTSTCPSCGSKLTCPEPLYDAEVVEMGPPPGKPAGFDPFGDIDDDKPRGLPQPAAAEPSSEGRRPCPMCGEMIVATAAKCRYCGEVFDSTLKKAKGKKKSKKHGPEDEDLSTSEVVVAVLCSGIGCIAGIVWMIQGKPKGLKMFGISIVMVVVWNVINLVVRQSLHQ